MRYKQSSSYTDRARASKQKHDESLTPILFDVLGMVKKEGAALEKLIQAEIAELRGLRKDMKLIRRRLDAINESLAPISQEAREELNARKEEREAEELEQALYNELRPIFEKKLKGHP